jgi:ATP-dependent helicase HrpB
VLSDADLLAVAHVDRRRGENRIFLAAPVSAADITDFFGDHVETDTHIAWDPDARLVRARRQEHLGALLLKDGPIRDPDPTAMAHAMLDGVRAEGLDLLNWTDNARQLQRRMIFLYHHVGGDWPDARDAALLDTLEDWLLPHVYGMKRADDLTDLHVAQLLQGLLTWEQRQQLDDLAPTHLMVPSGFRRPLDYSDPASPVLAVRLQEMFGQTHTPHIADGRVAVTIHLLSPAQRPVQITQDLEHFWNETYFEVRKDMRGRYPKHYWPEDPHNATPTHRVRPEGM